MQYICMYHELTGHVSFHNDIHLLSSGLMLSDCNKQFSCNVCPGLNSVLLTISKSYWSLLRSYSLQKSKPWEQVYCIEIYSRDLLALIFAPCPLSFDHVPKDKVFLKKIRLDLRSDLTKANILNTAMQIPRVTSERAK